MSELVGTKPKTGIASFYGGIRKAIEKLPKTVRFRAINACEGLEKAYRLLEIDREIASFRAITAEEEAVTALFQAFTFHKYPGASRLGRWSHTDKAAVFPFLEAVHTHIARNGELELLIQLDYASKIPSIQVSVPLSYLGLQLTTGATHITSVDPFGMMSRHGPNETVTMFETEIQSVVDSRSAKTFEEIVRVEANRRNLLLYASDTALPESKLTQESLDVRKTRICILLLLVIGVMQTPAHQPFAVQCLDALLRTIKNSSDSIIYPSPSDPEVSILVKAPGQSEITIHKKA